MRRWSFAVAVIAATVLAAAAAAAGAVEPFGPGRDVPSLGAHCLMRTVLAGVPARGFGDCDRVDANGVQQHDRLAYFELSANGWRGRMLSVLGHPRAMASDATGTYALIEGHDPSRNPGAAIMKRDGQGRYTTRYLGADGSVGGAGLVARAGKWWAVWSCVRTAGREYSLCEAGTLFGPTAARAITADAAGDGSASLALTSDGRLGLMWTREHQTTDGGTEAVRFATSTGHGWVSQQLDEQTNGPYLSPQVSTDGQHFFGTWVQNSRPLVASDEAGAWKTRIFPTRSCANTTRIAAAPAAVYVTVNQCASGDAATGTASGTAVVVLERRNSTWTSNTVSTSSRPGFHSAAIGTQSAGKAIVLFEAPDITSDYTRSQ